MCGTPDIEGLRSLLCAIDHVASEVNICSVIMYAGKHTDVQGQIRL